ncbi:MAG: radical SAM/Cys-rich protein [Chitinophagales bacterium]|jgi:radical SAM/Cys-rich protein|tara:strand:+ start:9472 stop:10461 length:990 start_codon:yes stop_codon:yes gene_type:complete
MRDTKPLLLPTAFPAIKRASLDTLQVNLGYLCNMTCMHCHVNAGPTRTEIMTLDVIDSIIDFIREHAITTLDLTGGAPEMNPHFRYLVEQARAMDVAVIDRCNLTILLEDGYEGLAEFLAAQQVIISASLPCYEEENVEQQRGKGVYSDSITALKKLNKLGYGRSPELVLDLVYNPTGAVLPPPQVALQSDYKRELKKRFDIDFDGLLTITNMPISRFGSVLLAHNQFDDYLNLLKDNFNKSNLATLMCKSLLSVDWQGYIYDCDFNQMLDMPLVAPSSATGLLASDKKKLHISELVGNTKDWPIAIGEHCYGCTAGQGSSCGGALDAA